MLNLDKYQIDWICNHLGHTKNVHKIHYRQMSGLIERTQVTKLLMLQDLNLTQRFKGKTLEQIDLQDIVFPDTAEAEDVESSSGDFVNAISQDDGAAEAVDPVVFETVESDEDPELEEIEIVMEKRKTKTHHKRQRFDQVEMEELNKYFKTYIEAGLCLRTKAVEAAKKESRKRQGKIWKRTNDKIIKKISAINHKVK